MHGHIRERFDKATGKRRTGWQARYTDPADARRYIGKTFKKKSDAQRWLTEQMASAHRGDHHDPRRSARPFKDVVAAWRETWPGRIEPRTVTSYESTLRTYLLPEFGERPVGSITHEVVQRWINRLNDGQRSPATIRGVYAVLRTAMGYGVRMGIVRNNPCTHVDLPRAQRQEMLFLTGEQVATLAHHIDPRYRTLVYVAAYTGLRAGELGGLRRRDVDLLRNVLHVRQALKDINGRLEFGPTKTHAQRTVSLPGFLREMLALHLTPAPGGTASPDDLVFAGKDGRPIRHGLVYNRHFKPAVAKAIKAEKLPKELEGLRFHDLRHTCAALSIAAGAHPKLISARLGHSSITITLDRYGHLFPSMEETLGEALDAAFSAGTHESEVVVLADRA